MNKFLVQAPKISKTWVLSENFSVISSLPWAEFPHPPDSSKNKINCQQFPNQILVLILKNLYENICYGNHNKIA